MTQDSSDLRLETLDDRSTVGQISNYYEVEDFEKQLRQLNGSSWKEWLHLVWVGLAPAVLFVGLLSWNHNVWLQGLVLIGCIESMLLLHQQRARKREEVLVRCLRALITAVSAAEAKHR